MLVPPKLFLAYNNTLYKPEYVTESDQSSTCLPAVDSDIGLQLGTNKPDVTVNYLEALNAVIQ